MLDDQALAQSLVKGAADRFVSSMTEAVSACLNQAEASSTTIEHAA
jgi:hypothetical protein